MYRSCTGLILCGFVFCSLTILSVPGDELTGNELVRHDTSFSFDGVGEIKIACFIYSDVICTLLEKEGIWTGSLHSWALQKLSHYDTTVKLQADVRAQFETKWREIANQDLENVGECEPIKFFMDKLQGVERWAQSL